MGDPQEIFNILIEQKLNNYGIALSDGNYQKPGADTKTVKCFQRGLDLTNQSKTKISNYFGDIDKKVTEVEFYNRYYEGITDEVKCITVGGITSLDLYKEVHNDLQVKVDKGKDNKGEYIKIYGYDYNLGNIYYKSPILKKFDISKCNWKNNDLVRDDFKGCLSQFHKNDQDIINNKYIHAEYDIINDTPVFDYLYLLGDIQMERNYLDKSSIYNNNKISDTFKCIYNCSTQSEMNFIEKTDEDRELEKNYETCEDKELEKNYEDEELEKKRKTCEHLKWYNLINKTNSNIIGFTDDLKYSHREHLYNQFNLFINDVMEYFENKKSFDNIKESFKKIFMTDDEKFYSHVIKSFLVPYLLKDYNTINMIPKFSGSLYLGKVDISGKANKFIDKYYAPNSCTYTHTDKNDNEITDTFVFNNDNSYNSVLYAYKFDSVNNMFDRIKDVEFSKLQDKDSNGNYIYSNLMKDVDEKTINNTENYIGASVYDKRVYKQKLEYNIYEPSTDEHQNSVDIYEAERYDLHFYNAKSWYYNPKGYYNHCCTTEPDSHDDETCKVNNTKFYTKMTTQSCGVSGKDIIGGSYKLEDIYNQGGQKIKKIGSSDKAYCLIIAKDDIEDIRKKKEKEDRALLKIGDEIKVTYDDIDCGRGFSDCLYGTVFDMRIYSHTADYANDCNWPCDDEKNSLIQPYANGDYVAYLRYLYKNIDNYSIPCVNKEISYNDACDGIGVGDTSDYISYDQYKKLFRINYDTSYDWGAMNKAEPYYLKKECSYSGKYILNNSMTNEIKNTIINNSELWCKTDCIDSELFYPMKRIDYSTLTYVIDDRYLYILRYLFNNFLDELVINIVNDIIQLVYDNPNMYLANKLKGLYYIHNKGSNKYYLTMENPFNNILLYSEDSTIVPNYMVKTEFPKVYQEAVSNCLIDTNHKTRYKVYPENYPKNNNIDKIFSNMGTNYLNIATDDLAYPRLSIKNDLSASNLLYSEECYIVDNTRQKYDENSKYYNWNTKGFIFKPDIYMLYDDTKQTNNYNQLDCKTTTLPFILYHYWTPNGAAPKFAFEYSSLIDNVEIWYKLDDDNIVVKTGTDHISSQKDPSTNQIIITNLVNNTEFYKYTKPPSCLMPNNSDLNYMY